MWRRGVSSLRGWLSLAVWLGCATAAPAQGTTGPTVADNTVGYIDNAIPGNVFRLRYDTAYDFTRASRAEFFYAAAGPGRRGLPLVEQRIDYQEVSAYGEHLLLPRLSLFILKPLRLLNPEVNSDHSGLGDLQAGCKYAFWQDEATTVTFQFRTYIPTGNVQQGLGTGHVSLEPGFLFFHNLTGRLALAGEFEYWIPVGGTDFAGDILIYGAGLQYNVYRSEKTYLTPVAECIGWTVLSGKESVVFPSGAALVRSAAGDTILNGKLGCRVGLGTHADMYMGYGQALTGERWYRDIFRAELRVFY
jgi:hypothetical protein